jgi:predicted permease
VISFFKTPVILAILGGLLFKQTGLIVMVSSNALSNSILETLSLLGSMTTPLVAIVIGYQLEFRAGALRLPLRTVATRVLIWAPFGLVMSLLLMGRWLELDPVFQAAMMTMVILPPPFVIPLFVRDADAADTDYIVNTLTLATIVTLFAYTLVPVFFPPG